MVSLDIRQGIPSVRFHLELDAVKWSPLLYFIEGGKYDTVYVPNRVDEFGMVVTDDDGNPL